MSSLKINCRRSRSVAMFSKLFFISKNKGFEFVGLASSLVGKVLQFFIGEDAFFWGGVVSSLIFLALLKDGTRNCKMRGEEKN